MERRAAACRWLCVSLRRRGRRGARSAAPQQTPVFRAGVDLVNLGVTVTDKKGTLVTDLTADDFEVFEDGQKQTVTLLRAGAAPERRARAAPRACCSTSARAWARTSRFTRTAAIKFLNALHRAPSTSRSSTSTPRCAWRGTSQTEFAAAGRADPAAEGRAATRRSTTRLASTSTARRSRTGARSCCSTPTAATRAARCGFGELLDLLKASDVTVYAIGVLEHQSLARARSTQRSMLRPADRRDHRRAGVLPARRSRSSTRCTSKVLAEIRAQYTLGYVSTNDAAPTAPGGRSRSEIGRDRAGDVPGPDRARATSRRLQEVGRA